jgi:hypothetical protein
MRPPSCKKKCREPNKRRPAEANRRITGPSPGRKTARPCASYTRAGGHHRHVRGRPDRVLGDALLAYHRKYAPCAHATLPARKHAVFPGRDRRSCGRHSCHPGGDPCPLRRRAWLGPRDCPALPDHHGGALGRRPRNQGGPHGGSCGHPFRRVASVGARPLERRLWRHVRPFVDTGAVRGCGPRGPRGRARARRLFADPPLVVADLRSS